MENGTIRFHLLARTVMMALIPEDRDVVLRAIESLGASPPKQWPEEKVHKLDTPGNVYVLHASPTLRVIFRLTEDQTVEILDIVFRDTLKAFATKVG